MNVKNEIKKLMSNNWRLVVSIVILFIFTLTIKIVSPLIIKHIIDNIVLNINGSTKSLLIWFLTLFGLTFICYILDSQRFSKVSILGNSITSCLSSKSYSIILHSELNEIKKLDKDSMINKLSKVASNIGDNYFGQNVFNFFYESLLLFGLFIVELTISPFFGLLMLFFIPLFYILTKYIDRGLEKRNQKVLKVCDEQIKMLNESLEQIKTIKLKNGIDLEEAKYANLISRLEFEYRRKKNLESRRMILLPELFVSLCIIGIILIGSVVLLKDNTKLSLGGILASTILVPIMYRRFRILVKMKILPRNIKEDVVVINEILTMKPENRIDTVTELEEIYSLKFKDVSFDYGINSKFSLDDINFEVKRGEKLGILGLANSGKTTIVDLATKIIRPKQGSILINNCDINKVNTYYLRELITTAPQNVKLFNDTIEKNIIYPLEFDEYKYNDALNKCHLKPLLSTLDKKDQTFVNDERLSNTDCQKIALANAFYKDSKIFLLDETINKVEPSVEIELMDEINKLKNKIIILVSNRIHNLMKCDKILIINNGKVIEYGKTNELLTDSKSTFARMMAEYENTRSRVI